MTMDPEVHRRALRAAAKTTQNAARDGRAHTSALLRTTLALGLTGSFVGCAMQHAHEPVFEDAAPLADAPGLDTGADAPGTPDTPVECDAHLAALDITTVGDEGWSPAQFTDEAARTSQATADCCHRMELDVRAARDRGDMVGWPPSPLAMACCDVVVFVNHLESVSELGCTPWGPPCPPDMPA